MTLTRYCHKKRGTEYELIGYGTFISHNPAHDGDDVRNGRVLAIYRSVDGGALWVRPREEFEDRFEALPLPPAVASANNDHRAVAKAIMLVMQGHDLVQQNDDGTVTIALGQTYLLECLCNEAATAVFDVLKPPKTHEDGLARIKSALEDADLSPMLVEGVMGLVASLHTEGETKL